MKILTLSSTELASASIDYSNVLIFMPFINPKEAKNTAEILSRRANAQGNIICIYDSYKEGFVTIANKAFRQTKSTYVGYLAEDAFPGRNWLNLGLKKIESTSSSLLAFNDGKWQGNLAAFGLVKRVWAANNYQGDLFYPQYKKHYADTELTLLAKEDKVFTYDPHSILIEIDWEKDKKSTEISDKNLFLERSKNGFDGRITNQTLLGIFS